MDDNNFDDILKSKFRDYEYADVTSEALSAFHNRTPSFKRQWYAAYPVGTFVAVAFMFTVLNGLIVWYGIDANESRLTKIEGELNHKVIDSLTFVINQLRSERQTSSVIIDPYGVPAEELHHSSSRYKSRTDAGSSTGNTENRVHLGPAHSLPTAMFERLKDEGLLEIKNGEAYLVNTEKATARRQASYSSQVHSELMTRDSSDSSVSASPNAKDNVSAAKVSNLISVKMLNQIADHQYTSGVGIYLTPHVDLVVEVFSEASGSFAPRIGLTAEFVTSPHWSLETAIDYLTTKFTITDNLQSFNLPAVSSDLGTLERAQVRSRTLSTPVNLKYRMWLTQKRQLVIKAGFTPYFYLNNQYVYQYPYPNRPADSDLNITTVEEKDQSGYYGGTLSTAVGIRRLIKRNSQFEASLFYERSLGKIGPEKLNLQLFGIRTAYSIRVK